MHDHGVALTGKLEERRELGSLGVLARRPVGKDAVERDAVELAVRMLVNAADSDVAEALATQHRRFPTAECQAELYDLF